MAATQAQLRILKEITGLQKSSDLSLAVSFREDNVRRCRALIVGPPETPYEFCFFEFNVEFGPDYPTSAPAVRVLTTNGGSTRFNPNIYADGKVCLSILGTWRGEPGEQWSSAQGLESILISIQSLMSSNPYENEPGFENANGESEKVEARDYANKVRHESLRLAVAEPLEDALRLTHEGKPLPAPSPLDPPAVQDGDDDEEEEVPEFCIPKISPFRDFMKRRFMWYYDSYLKAIDAALGDSRIQEGGRFRTMPFEHNGNGMNGTYTYKLLRKRFEAIHAAIVKETEDWTARGHASLQNESPVAFGFQNKLRHLSKALQKTHPNVELASIDGNPLAWRLTIFGRASTLLEGGIFNVSVVIPTEFPARMPRVRVETPIFHQRVAPDGTLCYMAPQSAEIDSHITAIIAAVQEESPPYDPRTVVNLAASTLLWGSDSDKRAYRRNLRRSAERSSEM